MSITRNVATILKERDPGSGRHRPHVSERLRPSPAVGAGRSGLLSKPPGAAGRFFGAHGAAHAGFCEADQLALQAARAQAAQEAR